MRRTSAAIGLAVLIVVLVLLAIFASRPLLVLFAGVLLAVLLRALADVLVRYAHVSRGLALGLVAVLLFGLVAGSIWFFTKAASAQFEQLGGSLTSVWHEIERELGAYARVREHLQHLYGSGGDSDALGRMAGRALAALSALVVSIFVGLYLAADPSLYRRGFLHLVPKRSRRRAEDVLDAMERGLRGWLLGTLFNMIVVGTVTTVALWAIGTPLALALGIIAFFLEFIPYLGPIASAVPAMLVAATVSPAHVFYTALLYLAIHAGEGYLLAPLVYQRSIALPPAVRVAAQLLLGTFFGVLGLMFATPLTACALLLVQRIYVEDALGDPVTERRVPPRS
jgi:predicted PurR-regulated permease PerM